MSTAGMFTNMRYRPNDAVLPVAVLQRKFGCWCCRSRVCGAAIESGDGAIQIILFDCLIGENEVEGG